MAQTSYPRKMNPAVVGMLSDSSYLKHCDSLRNDETTAELRFGTMVAKSSTAGGATLIDATDDALAGVVVYSQAYDEPTELGDDGLEPDTVASVATRARMWVYIEETVAVGDPVRVRAVAAGAEVAGAFRTTADGTDCIDISAFARWVTGGTAVANVGMAEIEFDMLMSAQAVADV